MEWVFIFLFMLNCLLLSFICCLSSACGISQLTEHMFGFRLQLVKNGALRPPLIPLAFLDLLEKPTKNTKKALQKGPE